jgi:hypothetical protein
MRGVRATSVVFLVRFVKAYDPHSSPYLRVCGCAGFACVGVDRGVQIDDHATTRSNTRTKHKESLKEQQEKKNTSARLRSIFTANKAGIAVMPPYC